MDNITKTFRLFISSTFSDFKVEREVLQTNILPQIKEYCSSKGYTFQPIDLRWGVGNEAQLDQKALDICINEVQSCKSHAYPNFLIMLGDRYGWIPLPRIIEKQEFESILKLLDDKDKNIVIKWYKKDENQLPISYILQERKDEYVDYNNWLLEEDKLKKIFQDNVNIQDKKVDKYFTSATQAEAIEGILSYNQTTQYQEKLVKLIPNFIEDHKHIFGFFRNIEISSKLDDTFMSDDYNKAQEFKQQIKETLDTQNILNITTKQLDSDTLDTQYLEQFISSVTNFLIAKVDEQISNDSKNKYTTLQFELKQQNNFLNTKINNFLGQEDILNSIQEYILNDNDTPLILYGKSGIGKSSIIAQAIINTTQNIDKRIIYRFIGATSNSTTTKDILTSILDELDISIEEENLEDKRNNFTNITDIFYNYISNSKDDIVIFIDAVDQLTNDDQFLWLPNKLPSNIKFIISALNDRNYKEDSKYYRCLNDKTSNILEIKPFDKPIELLNLLLKNQNRTLQKNQQEYFLSQYEKVQTPFYVYIASQEMKYWKSDDIIEKDILLKGTQKDIVKTFIKNLTSKHHHNKKLVEKVLGYIVASNDGLSESEILELLSTDERFIQELAPDTWHTNITKELPIVIWTRLYNHLKSFLSKKNQDAQELLYFFHREFVDVIENSSNQQNEHESIVEATQELILKYQDKEFDSNRWGKLYILLLIEYYIVYNDKDIIIEYYSDVLQFLDHDIVLEYLKYMGIKQNQFKIDENGKMVNHLVDIIILVHLDSFYLRMVLVGHIV